MNTSYRNRTRAVRGAAREHLRQLRADRLSRRSGAGAVAESEGAPGETCDTPTAYALSISAAAETACTSVAADIPSAPGADDPGPSGRADAVEDGPCLDDTRMPKTDEVGASQTGRADGGDGERAPPGSTAGRATPRAAFPAQDAETDADKPPPPPGNGADAVADTAGIRVADGAGAGAVSAAPSEQDGPGGPGGDALPATGDGRDRAAASTEAVDPVSADDPDPLLPGSDLHTLPGAGPGLVWMLQQCGVSSLTDLGRADPAILSDRMGLVGQMLDLESWVAFAARVASDPVDPDETR